MPLDLKEIRTRTVSANDYLNDLEEPFKDKFLTRKQTYQLDREAIGQLREFAGKYVIIAFSAEWCKDCAANIPVLVLISEAAGLEVRVFGGLKKDPLNQVHKWRIPPSPQEVEAFNVQNIPVIIVVGKEGREIGRIVEKPSRRPTLEQEISEIIRSAQ